VQHEVEGYQRDKMHRSMTKEDGHCKFKCLETDQNPHFLVKMPPFDDWGAPSF
jgi:hypothetical protein